MTRSSANNHRVVDPTISAMARRAKEGSLPCFAELVKRLEGRLFNFLLRRTGSADDAEDLTQEAFVRAWQRIERYDPRYQFTTWLFTIANRLAATHYRRARRESVVRSSLQPSAEADSPASVIAEREQGRLLWDIADRVLTDTQRTALWLRFAEDLPVREIAAVMGKSRVTVRVTLLRARNALAACAGTAESPSRVASLPAPAPTRIHELQEQLAGELSC